LVGELNISSQKRVKAVAEFRVKEEKDGFEKYKFTRKLFQIANDVKIEDAEQPDSASGKKQKRDDTLTEKSKEDFKIIYIDE
jgi:hypothetical protein